jgi:guanyl-specific ribonuclease Sa
MRKPGLLIAAIVVLLAGLWALHALQRPPAQQFAPTAATPYVPPPATGPDAAGETGTRLPSFLPAEAARTIALIRRGGPFAHRQDGAVFGNREGHLPQRPRGYYHEYTVETPGARDRGARRIITGGTPPAEWYYSDDHYDSFRRFDVPEDRP